MNRLMRGATLATGIFIGYAIDENYAETVALMPKNRHLLAPKGDET